MREWGEHDAIEEVHRSSYSRHWWRVLHVCRPIRGPLKAPSARHGGNIADAHTNHRRRHSSRELYCPRPQSPGERSNSCRESIRSSSHPLELIAARILYEGKLDEAKTCEPRLRLPSWPRAHCIQAPGTSRALIGCLQRTEWPRT